MSVDRHDHAELLFGRKPLDHFERNLRIGLAVQPDERGLGNTNEGVIHLEIKKRAHALGAHLVEAARRAVWPRHRQGGERAAVAVGGERDMILRRQENFAGRTVDGRHLTLCEESHVLEPEAVVAIEKIDRGLVVFRACHDIERNRSPMAPSQRDDLLGMDLKEARRRDRPDRECSLRSLKAEPRSRSAGDQDDPDFAGCQCVGAQAAGAATDHPLAVGLRQSNDVDRLHAVFRRDGRAVALDQLANQALQLVEIDRGELGGQACLLVAAQFPPPLQQMTLPVLLQAFDKDGVGRHFVRGS